MYADVDAAKADYELIHDLHTKEGLIDAYDAAVIQRRDDGKVKIVRKHETPTRVGGVLGGGVGLATGLVVALFPFAAIGGGLLAATAAGGTVLGALAGHAAAGMSRNDLKELGEQLDAGQAGLVVVAVSDMGAKIEREMKRAEKIQAKELKADVDDIERDAAAGDAAVGGVVSLAGDGPRRGAPRNDVSGADEAPEAVGMVPRLRLPRPLDRPRRGRSAAPGTVAGARRRRRGRLSC